jgi:hypothetical protein
LGFKGSGNTSADAGLAPCDFFLTITPFPDEFGDALSTPAPPDTASSCSAFNSSPILFFSSIFSCLFALLIILSFSFLSFYPFDLSMGLSGLFHLLMVRSMPRGRLQHKTSFLLYSVSMSGLAETTIQQLLQPAVSARRQSAFFGISHNDSVPARSRSSSSTISAASPTCRRQGRDA